MPSFSIPADFQLSTMEQIGKRNEKWDMPIKDVYGCLNPSIFGSGRTSSAIHQTSFNDLKKYVDSCNKNQVQFNYALNFNCASNMEFTDEGKKEITKFLRKLYDIGVRRFTAVLPSIMLLIQNVLPDAKVTVSVISNVDSLTRLKVFLSLDNVDRIMLPENMNRKVGRLEKLTKQGNDSGIKFGTIVNGLCLIDCPYREFHYSFNSHAVGKKSKYTPGDYYATRCTLFKLQNPSEILKMGWIRPEDLKYYIAMGIDVFKLAGREMLKPDFLRVVDIYNQESYDGNLWELFRCFSSVPASEPRNYPKLFNMPNKDIGVFTQRFFESKYFCSTKDCETCNYCTSNAHLISVNDFDMWNQSLQKELATFTNKT